MKGVSFDGRLGCLDRRTLRVSIRSTSSRPRGRDADRALTPRCVDNSPRAVPISARSGAEGVQDGLRERQLETGPLFADDAHARRRSGILAQATSTARSRVAAEVRASARARPRARSRARGVTGGRSRIDRLRAQPHVLQALSRRRPRAPSKPTPSSLTFTIRRPAAADPDLGALGAERACGRRRAPPGRFGRPRSARRERAGSAVDLDVDCEHAVGGEELDVAPQRASKGAVPLADDNASTAKRASCCAAAAACFSFGSVCSSGAPARACSRASRRRTGTGRVRRGSLAPRGRAPPRRRARTRQS